MTSDQSPHSGEIASPSENVDISQPPLTTGHRPLVTLLPSLELALAAIAGALWYLQGGWVWYAGTWPGPWPLLLLAVMVALTISREGLRAFRLSPFSVPLLAFAATAGVALWAAYDPEIALAKGWLLIAALGLYWALAHQPDDRRLYISLGFWALFCIALTAYFFVTNDWADHPMKVPVLTRLGAAIAARLPRLTAHQIHPNVAGGLLAVALPFCAPLLTLARRRRGQFLYVALYALGIAGLVIGILGWVVTVSRGAWVALAAAAGLWAVWRFLARWGSRRQLIAMVALCATGALVGGIGAWLVLDGRLSDIGRVGSYADAAQSLIANRLRLLRLGALLASDTPFTGIGLGMFEMPFSIYTLLIHVGYIEHSHNLFLDLAIEQSIAGVVAFGMMAATAFIVGTWRGERIRVKRRRRKSESELGKERQTTLEQSAERPLNTRLITEAALASLAALLIHGLVDDALYGSRGVLVLLVPFGMLAGSFRFSVLGIGPRTPNHMSHFASPNPKAMRSVRTLSCIQLALVPLLTTLGIAGILIVRGDSRAPLVDRWVAAWHANLGATAQARTELAVYDQHHFDDPTIDEVRRSEDLTAALAHFDQAVANDATNPTSRQRQAEIALARGEYDAALIAMQALWDAGHRDRVTRLLYGDALVAAGRVDEAVAVVQGLEFSKARLLGQAWSRYHLGGDARREAYAREAAEKLAE